MINNSVLSDTDYMQPLPYLGFIITLGSCFRLANFNIDTRQTNSFIGLPTPANALFIMSLPLVLRYTDSLLIIEILTNQWVLLAITAFSAFIMNAEIPLFSLKIKNFNVAENIVQIIFLLISISLLFFFRFLGIPLLILTYVLISIVNNRLQKK